MLNNFIYMINNFIHIYFYRLCDALAIENRSQYK